MSEASDGFGTGPVEERTRRAGRPPVPAAARADTATPPRDGAAPDGAVQDGAVREGVVQDGAVQDGAVQDGAGQNGAGREGAMQDGAVQDGAAGDGAVRDGAVQDGGHDGRHRTERVPFPVPGPGGPPAGPPVTVQQPAARPPETGRLELGGYPPRVPRAARPHPAAVPRHEGARDGD
ncbi:hypothetical protein GCM10023328_36340 [Modestobacter marinus]|uniref:Uncharacterized protein n=1 Tax=Modestobacter marinus TaxID=477641 RepID=A0ABQ2G4G8_9ACTN|nr:hypothetical protein GCM10011589_33030 [Modestobacter marinus]